MAPRITTLGQIIMKTPLSVYDEAISAITQALGDLTQEAATANLLGHSSCANDLRVVAGILNEAINSCDDLSFGNCVHLLGAFNSAAKLCERHATESDDSDRLFWFKHAYDLRTTSEKTATDLLHTVKHVPLFEESLAALRLSCALLARQLSLEDRQMFYIQGALRLAASEPLCRLAQSIMQTHQRN